MAKLAEVREAGLGSLDILQRAGVKIGYGTDLLGSMHRYQSHEFVIRAEAMAPFDIIRSATIVNAELLNHSGDLGVVAPGARADLIAIDGDPLADISLLDGQGQTPDSHHERRRVLQKERLAKSACRQQRRGVIGVQLVVRLRIRNAPRIFRRRL